MEVTMTCKHCGEVIAADDEDALVPLVQAHARSHDGGPELTREHILSRLHRLQRQRTDKA
jgi:hypothetical protein